MKPDIKILYRFEMKVTVRLPIEDEPRKRILVTVITEDHDDALKIGLYLARQRGRIQKHSDPKITDIAVAYYPNLPGQPDCTKEEIEELWQQFELPR